MHSSIILAGVLGIDLLDKANAVFIEDVTHDIKDMKEFIAYCKDNKGTKRTYGKAEKLERLDTLANEYKALKERIAMDAKYTAWEKYSKALAEKVKLCRDFVEEKCIKFSEVVIDGEKFKDHELRALKAVGSQSVVLEYSYTNRLAGEIYKACVENSRKKKTYELGHNQENEQKLLSSKEL